MIDDDVATLLKLDARGLHAGGTVQAGSRPVFIASGGATLNPPDLGAARDALRHLVEDVREAATPSAIASALPDLASAVPAMAAALPEVRDAARDAAPAAMRRIHDAAGWLARTIGRWAPDARDRRHLARDAEAEARRLLRMAPVQRSLVGRAGGPTPVILGVGAAVLAAGAVAVLADAGRRRRVRRLMRRGIAGVRNRFIATPAPRPVPAHLPMPIAIPIEPDARPRPLSRAVSTSADLA